MVDLNAAWQDCLHCAWCAIILLGAFIVAFCGLVSVMSVCVCKSPRREIEEHLSPETAQLQAEFILPPF